MNVFKKCLRKEFGNSKYMDYVQMCEQDILDNIANSSKLEDKKIYKDMYELLKKKNDAYIDDRTEKLMDTLFVGLQISRKFTFIIIFYIGANFLLLTLGLNYYITCISLALMGACFIYKLIEFVSNKYCFVDAYIIMIYKSVLEKLAGRTVK